MGPDVARVAHRKVLGFAWHLPRKGADYQFDGDALTTMGELVAAPAGGDK